MFDGDEERQVAKRRIHNRLSKRSYNRFYRVNVLSVAGSLAMIHISESYYWPA